MEIFTHRTLLSSVFALFFAAAMVLGGCTADSLTGPEPAPDSPEVENYNFITPGDDYRNNGGDGGSNSHGDSRNETGEEGD